MTTGNPLEGAGQQRDSGEGSRLDRIEAALEVLIRQQAATDRRIDRLTEQTEANSRAIEALAARTDANALAIADLTVQVAEANNMAVSAITNLVDVADDIIGRIDVVAARVDENSGYIRGLQTENRRILDILQQRGEQNGQQ
ncbi:hypothetical protein [Gloeobacter kilaueensis]|uniref:Uncharacterized protein n=1 Tax=Gloeobacter kilaueensis (strain ATCC BAA-2537 / CCAP 1431/1 / ULC 316 / JS1) TaxID=1183438 RepID=U5QF58_GLOK1|nr:hypothetical protein [Gloeobacter kilaueensis]AGY57602.1 hypothetical protein GKIL_1356 [Gloeobacter kilaueensis JS1]